MGVTRGELQISIIIIFSFNSFLPLQAQTDPSVLISPKGILLPAISTTYKSVHYKPRFIAGLPGKIMETSGLLYFNGQIWTHNDSGNPPEIYQVDSVSGSILRTVVIRNSVNKDWEGMAQDDSSVYIGDFGNNSGERKDLKILKIAKSELLNPVNDSVNAGYIHFIYPDLTHFEPAFNKNNFDCEAFFFYDDSLHLFSKDWADLQTRHYAVPAEPGWYKARFVDQFQVDGLITDASINQQGKIVLLGYKNTSGRSYICFAWLLSGYNGPEFFGGKRRRIELGSALHLGQTEGIVLKNDNTGWISSESIQSGWFNEPAKLFGFDFGNYY
ncbi:MAG: hypothetical protein Q7U54_10715 [Bacteroidales bacterium]|nr:hypothetical protein [Bacteroidales bacterium]